MKSAIVTTTVFVPTFLTKYAENLKQYGHDTSIIVVGDRKTPEGVSKFCESIHNCIYLDVADQHNYLRGHSHFELLEHLPLDNISRRNIGHLMAYEAGAECIIMLDDDNLATTQDVVKHHSVVGQRVFRTTYGSSSGWFNICSALKEKHGVEFYARGYPPSQRWKGGLITVERGNFADPDNGMYRKVAVNGGLWLNDPDIDALTRLERYLIVIGVNDKMPSSFALHPGTWSPWNCQNTAISRDALPSYFLSPHTGRHLDIWASYITSRIAEALGEVITFGVPLAYHERTPHNLYKDLEQELPWIQMTDGFVEALRSTKIVSSTYTGALREIIEGLRENWFVSDPVKEQYLNGLRIWNDIFIKLGA